MPAPFLQIILIPTLLVIHGQCSCAIKSSLQESKQQSHESTLVSYFCFDDNVLCCVANGSVFFFKYISLGHKCPQANIGKWVGVLQTWYLSKHLCKIGFKSGTFVQKKNASLRKISCLAWPDDVLFNAKFQNHSKNHPPLFSSFSFTILLCKF